MPELLGPEGIWRLAHDAAQAEVSRLEALVDELGKALGQEQARVKVLEDEQKMIAQADHIIRMFMNREHKENIELKARVKELEEGILKAFTAGKEPEDG